MTHFDQGTLVASTAFPVTKTKRRMKSVKRPKQPPTLVLRGCPLSQTRRSPGPLSAQRPPRPAREAGDRMPHLPPGLLEPPPPAHLRRPHPLPALCCPPPTLPPTARSRAPSWGCRSEGASERIPARGPSAPWASRPRQGTPAQQPGHPPAGPPGS